MGRHGLTFDHLVFASSAPYVLLLLLSISGWLGPERVAACLFLLLLVRACDASLALASEAEVWARAIVGTLEAAELGGREPAPGRPRLAQILASTLSDLMDPDARPSGPIGYLLWPLGASLLEFCLGGPDGSMRPADGSRPIEGRPRT